MKKAEEIKKILLKHKKEIEKRFNIKDMGLFGSCVRGEQRPGSDVDILVQFRAPIGLLKFVALERYLSGLIDQKVDLVMKSALKPRIGKHILAEVVYL